MPALRVTSRAKIKHGPKVAGVVAVVAGVVAVVAGVVTVSRKYGDSLFSRMATYINVFMSMIPHIKSVILLYSNKPTPLRGMISINTLIYVTIRLNSEPPYAQS